MAVDTAALHTASICLACRLGEHVRCACGAVRKLDDDGGMPVHPDMRRLPRLKWCEHSRQDRWITASE